MAFMTTSYEPATVALSILIAVFASFVTLDLIRHVRASSATVARRWLVGGSVAIAAGLWSMHFTGMHSLELPVPIRYRMLPTALSFVAAFAVSTIALSIAARGEVTTRCFVIGSLLMGGGLSAMHYAGTAAIDVGPVVWRLQLVGLSALLAVAASAAMLAAFAWLPTVAEDRRVSSQGICAIAMGLLMSAAHYSGMAGARFPVGAVSVVTRTLPGANLADAGYLAAFLLLTCALLMSIMDDHMARRAAQLAASLQAAHDRLASADDAIRQSARLDPLTKLLNRVAFEDQLAATITALRGSPAGAQPPRQIAVLFANITGLRAINDALGHSSGDEVIRQSAHRISALVRTCDVVARFSSDRFLVMMNGVERREDCAALADRIIAAMHEPFDVFGRAVQAGIAIGIALHAADAGDPADQNLIFESDAAMQAARDLGRSSHAFFETHMRKKMSEEFDLVADLRQAIELGQLELHYQPKIDSGRGTLCGVEALLRWTHPVRGAVGPAVFIPLAERFGLINVLGNWVIEQACAQLGDWQRAGVTMRVAINLSAHQLRENDLVARIESMLERHQVDPSLLLCEITESVAMQDIEATQRTLEALGAIGIFLSIDDFGTGYSSLSYLRQLPAKQLKIDRSFVADVEASSDARALVDAIVRLSHALGLAVVAEGVETAAQRDILVRLGCDELQGFYFARPMTAAKLLEWTRSSKRPKDALAFSKSLVLDQI
jgi:diguanylate cyclase (GGDEF)-like protein